MSGLKEKPIEHSKNQINYDDTLEVIDYAKALVSFIETCSPPITIGIQGDWGSGKTSLLNMMLMLLPRAAAARCLVPLFATKSRLMVASTACSFACEGNVEARQTACDCNVTIDARQVDHEGRSDRQLSP